MHKEITAIYTVNQQRTEKSRSETSHFC